MWTDAQAVHAVWDRPAAASKEWRSRARAAPPPRESSPCRCSTCRLRRLPCGATSTSSLDPEHPEARPRLAHELERGRDLRRPPVHLGRAVALPAGGSRARGGLRRRDSLPALHGARGCRARSRGREARRHASHRRADATLPELFGGSRPRFAMLAPEWEAPPAYRLFVETDAPDDQLARAAEAIERALHEGYHYRYAREFGQLGPVRAVRVTQGSFDTRRAASPGAARRRHQARGPAPAARLGRALRFRRPPVRNPLHLAPPVRPPRPWIWTPRPTWPAVARSRTSGTSRASHRAHPEEAARADALRRQPRPLPGRAGPAGGAAGPLPAPQRAPVGGRHLRRGAWVPVPRLGVRLGRRGGGGALARADAAGRGAGRARPCQRGLKVEPCKLGRVQRFETGSRTGSSSSSWAGSVARPRRAVPSAVLGPPRVDRVLHGDAVPERGDEPGRELHGRAAHGVRALGVVPRTGCASACRRR